jgi:hypothetical protein
MPKVGAAGYFFELRIPIIPKAAKKKSITRSDLNCVPRGIGLIAGF